MPVKNRLAQMQDEIAGWRREIHRHPELSFDLPRTVALVVEKLTAFGVDSITTGVGRSGVVAEIRGQSTRSGRAIGLRADMDALPIPEATGLAHASEVPGRMHACGHDGHTAMLLGAAKYLAETRNFDGTAVLIFQPAEEDAGGGLEMCRDGLMERWGIEEVYGMHNVPGLRAGSFATRAGPLMASCDEFEIVVTGPGGHAAAPQTTVDATLVAAQILIALNMIVSRGLAPTQRAVLSVPVFETDTAVTNILARSVRLKGTLRALDPEVRPLIEDRLRRIAVDTAHAHGATAEVNWEASYPVTVNSATEVVHALEAARAVTDDVDDDAEPLMPCEDFAYMLQERPGAYMFIGNGDSSGLHTPTYDFDDRLIPVGCSWFAELIERRMPATQD